MRFFVSGFLALSLLACSAEDTSEVKVADIDIGALHNKTLTLDTHVDIPLDYMKAIDPGTQTELQVDLGKLDQGRLDAAFYIVYTPQGDLTDTGYETALTIAQTRMSAIEAYVKQYSDRVALAKTAGDVRRIVSDGKHAVLVGMENAYPLGPSTDDLKNWADRGVRYVGLTHFGHNQFGDSSNLNLQRDKGPRHNGLSDLGRELIDKLNRYGVLVDLSHAGKETMMQAADYSKTPIIASHSGVKAVADSPRNVDDEQLRKFRDVGGVVQIVALDAYVKVYTPEQAEFRNNLRKEMGMETSAQRGQASAEKRAEYFKRLKGMWDIAPRANVSDLADHIDHAVKVAGIDHVGIASDFDGGGGLAGWEDVSLTTNVTAELARRGYSEEDIGKIWGGNLLRVMEAVESAAQ